MNTVTSIVWLGSVLLFAASAKRTSLRDVAACFAAGFVGHLFLTFAAMGALSLALAPSYSAAMATSVVAFWTIVSTR